MKVLCIINDGFEEIETVAPIDILRRAKIDVTIVSNNSNVLGAHKIQFSNILNIKDINYKEYDFLLLPGGPQYKQNMNDKTYLEIVKYFADNKSVAAVCASPTILGSLGYLKNKKYTCFPPMNEDFGGNFTASPAEIDGNIITGRGAGSSLEFGFTVLRFLAGPDVENKIKESMFY